MHILRPGGSQGDLPVRFKIALGHPRLPQGRPVRLRGALDPLPQQKTTPLGTKSSSKSILLATKIFHFQPIKCNTVSAVPIHIHHFFTSASLIVE